jgi:hypothetical protein
MLKQSDPKGPGLSNNEQERAEPVIACNLKAIDAAELDAHVALAQAVFSPSTILETKETVRGYAFRMPLETAMLHKAIDFIANERLCCPFFTFTLVVGEAFWLELSGSDEVKEYIKVNLIPAVQMGIFPTTEELEAAYIASTGAGEQK